MKLNGATMQDKAVDDAIRDLPYPKVTREDIERRIVDKRFLVLPGTTVTICHATLENGYSVRGESACVDKRNFNMAIGEKLAYEDAIRKLWPLEGYLLAERQWRKGE